MIPTQEMLDFLTNNPVIPTVASGGIVVWLITNIKSIFFMVKDGITSLISFTVYNNYADERGFGHEMYDKQVAFDRIVSSSKPIWERTTNLDLSSGSSWDDTLDNDYSGPRKALLMGDGSVPIKAYGFSVRILFGSIVFVNRGINKNQKITVDTSIRVFFARKRKFLDRLESEISKVTEDIVSKRSGGDIVNVYYGSRMYCGYTRKFRRNLDSIFLQNDEHKGLFLDVMKFLSNKETYKRINYPYKYSALLYGTPGSGKTSTILAIASELKRDIEYINLSTVTTTDLLDRMNTHPGRIFVFEDIDAIKFSSVSNRDLDKKRNSEDSNDETGDEDDNPFDKCIGVNLSDLLNITDGLLSSDGTICFFTTNHKERLDPAFLRAGRMNRIVEFRHMDSTTAERMVKYHLDEDITNLKDGIKPAELQETILDVKIGKKTIDDLKKEFC